MPVGVSQVSVKSIASKGLNAFLESGQKNVKHLPETVWSKHMAV
jgi:hypothetical protein